MTCVKGCYGGYHWQRSHSQGWAGWIQVHGWGGVMQRRDYDLGVVGLECVRGARRRG